MKEKYKIGEWYKCKEDSGYYGKLTGEYNISSGRFPSTEWIVIKDKKYYNDESYFIWKNIEKVDLKEIQQYLPDGHIDKIILPEKWYVEVTKENSDFLTIWKKGKGYDNPANQWKFVDYKGNGFNSLTLNDDRRIISFEQFKKYILKEETTPIQPNFDNCKIWIGNNPELSRKVQEALFELGYGWNSGTKFIVDYVNKTSLFIYPYNTLAYGSYNKAQFNEEPSRKIFPEDLGILDTKINLIDGQYYYCENTSWKGSYIFLKNSIENIKHIDTIKCKYLNEGWNFWTDENSINLRLATPEEKQWLNVCIAEDKFIDKDVALKKYYSDGTPITVSIKAEEFKVGDWIVVKNYLQCGEGNGIETENLVSQLYEKGFDRASGILLSDADFAVYESNAYYNIKSSHIIRKATNEEIGKTLVKIATKKYPIGTKYINLHDGTTQIVQKEFKYYTYSNNQSQITDSMGGAVYKDDKWATIVGTKSDTKPKTVETPTFKVGDWVTILKSDQNWADNGNMDKFVGKTVQITGVYHETQISFKDDESWTWEYKDKHFRPATIAEILSVTHIAAIDPYIGETSAQTSGRISRHLDDIPHFDLYPEVPSKCITKIKPVEGIIQEVKEYNVKIVLNKGSY